MDGRGAIEICLSEKGALAKKRLGNTALHYDSFYCQYKNLNVFYFLTTTAIRQYLVSSTVVSVRQWYELSKCWLILASFYKCSYWGSIAIKDF